MGWQNCFVLLLKGSWGMFRRQLKLRLVRGAVALYSVSKNNCPLAHQLNASLTRQHSKRWSYSHGASTAAACNPHREKPDMAEAGPAIGGHGCHAC